MYDAIRIFFDSFPLKLSTKAFRNTTRAMAVKYKSHSCNLSLKMVYQIRPDEEKINFIGYDF
jgi:hypothetical protein